MKRKPIFFISITMFLLVVGIFLCAGKAAAAKKAIAALPADGSVLPAGKAMIYGDTCQLVRKTLMNDTVAVPACYMVPAIVPAWWHMGDTVNFRFSGDMPPQLVSLSGVVTDVSGNEVACVKTGADVLKMQGWSWKPLAPGYYEVQFSFFDQVGKEEVLGRPVTLKMKNNASQVFAREKQGFAVMPASKPLKKVVGQFGFTYSNNPLELQLGKLVGFDLVRLLCDWGANFTNLHGGIESTKGQYDWQIFDKKVNLFANAGFVLNAQFCYTPLWASPFPEKTKINICVVEGTTYAPKDMNDFSSFVESAVGRYKDHISLWEIWNEPSIPGGSIFWSDTPENFVKLLEAGYKAVKKVQPKSQVWIGGLGPRAPYHAFYNKILQLGAGKYFDVLSLHGAWNTPAEKFSSIEEDNHVAPKPAVSGEWHAILQGNMQSEPILSESGLSLKMMKDLLYQIKQGISRTMLFEMINLSEKETLPFAIQNKIFTHSSGLFRRSPQIEPRHAAIVMANFLHIIGRKANYIKDFNLNDRAVSIELATANGPVIVFWSDSVRMPTGALKSLINSSSVLLDWEGKNISLRAGTLLDSNKLYYLSGINTVAIARAAMTNKLVSPRSQATVSTRATHGLLYNGELFGATRRPAKVPSSLWLESGWKATRLPGSQSEKSFSARAAIGEHESGIDIVVEVNDKPQVQDALPAKWSDGDNIHIAVDCEGTASVGGVTELAAALTTKGPVTWKVAAADPHGDIPARWSPANGKVKYVDQTITREGSLTRYQLRIPWSELYPLVYDTTKNLRLSIVVNSHNASLEWGGGAAREKDPSKYGVLNVK